VWPVLSKLFKKTAAELFSESGPAVFMSGSRGGVAKNEVTTAVFHLPPLVCFLKSTFFPESMFHLKRVHKRAAEGDLPHDSSVARARGSDSPSAVRYMRLHEKGLSLVVNGSGAGFPFHVF
jgi:hypothetical protein